MLRRFPLHSSALALALLLGCSSGRTVSAEPTAQPTVAPSVAPSRAAAAALSPSAAAVAPPSASPLVAAAPRAAPDFPPKIRLDAAVRGFRQPTLVTNAHDGSNRLFVLEKAGRILVVRDGGTLSTPFLDITARVGSRGSEQGLLGLAFHPDFANNGLFFVNYTDQNGDTVVARYRVSGNPDVADPDSEMVLLHIDQPEPNHNGGNLVFGPDGYLYIGMGDGGGGGDRHGQHGNGQNTAVLLGKMLRIDVNGGPPYGIPPDNPFAGDPNTKPEIWAYGLRNPWRYSFDRATGDLYIADVGQNQWEEVDFQPAGSPGGQNYGWNAFEGNHCFSPDTGCDPSQYTMPILEYDHSGGNCSITGGYVYRGPGFPQLNGLYFYGDYCSGRLWVALQDSPGHWRAQEILKAPIQISSFGEDEAGDVYVVGFGDGVIYRLAGA